MQVKIENSWNERLRDEFERPYFTELSFFVHSEYKKNKIFPHPKDIFKAFEFCPFDKVKVVILGQDPYHGEGQANGLCFSVNDNVALPPSLQNIFKEIEKEFEEKPNYKNGNLDVWAKQGILLLNSTLTVRAGCAGSHQKKGWEEFTDAVVRVLSGERNNIVFMLWGNYAKAKGTHIDRKKHLVLEAAHPSPFSAYNGFFGCNHFKLANDFLKKNGEKPIDWMIS